MNEIDLGMDTDQVMVIEMKGEKLKDAVKSVKGEIEMSSNIDFVKAANISPLSGGTVNMGITAGEKEVDASVMVVESGLMKMLNVKLDEGELFSDLPASDRKKKVLVNEAFVREAGLEEPIGSQVFGASTIIGVVKDFIYESAKKEIQPVMIVLADNANSYLYVHVSGNVSDGLKDVEKAITNFDPNYVFEYEFIDDVFAAKYEDEKRLSQVFGLFSILTIFIAGLGILGLSIFIAESRMKEIGIRKVLGAKIGQVVWLLNSGITALVMLVALITLPLVFHYTSGWLDGFAFRIELNPFHFILPLITLLGVLWSILFYQAYKSARSNPVNALRME